ncbi:uncharacterized protein N7443_007921 [Penicillium atrosanguineum]|uniref:uncharacterized protein n=1 Tax=Penicillium atrosanguineum TaxID=1132637 RepID=UPI002394BB81|nr:uncharacterized protein N7443_007921 [Penicillium atrosanguineum]KAJ5297028.1 hypothetical protein N7443_007921 [Penicillium atrosanguineum]
MEDSLPPVEATELLDLYSENVIAKIWRVAESYINNHVCDISHVHDFPLIRQISDHEFSIQPSLETYPEYVPESGPLTGRYESKPVKFWTCGFFPASLYCILERCTKFPRHSPLPLIQSDRISTLGSSQYAQLQALCRSWSAPLHAHALRTNTHDLGFMLHPLRMDWELTGDTSSLRAYITGAESLATRFDERVGAIRSWDQAMSHIYDIRDKENNFLIIVDNMDLIFYAAHITKNATLSAIATQHARTVLKTLIRPDASTWHVANLDQHAPQQGTVKNNMTHQGLADDSTWARGQAWAILGFAQTYKWTGDADFLGACMRLTEHFISRLQASPVKMCPWVPLWDFDDTSGELDSYGDRLRDASAGMVAANGMLLLHQVLQVQGDGGEFAEHDGRRYLDVALNIARDTIQYALDKEDQARLQVDAETGKVRVPPGSWDAILRHSTANNNPNAMTRYKDHGLVYADYYFLEFGNKLLRMGLV